MQPTKIIISNKIKLKRAPEKLNHILIENLKVVNPAHQSATKQGYSTWKIEPYIYNFSVSADDSLLIPRGYKNKLIEIIKNLEIPFEVEDKRTFFPPDFCVDSKNIEYRPYQKDAIIELTKVLNTGQQEGVIVAPPGSGKTVMGISLMPLLGQPTLWLTHTDRLAKQTLERVYRFLPSLKKEDIGYIGAGKWKIGKMFTVAMIQTLNRKDFVDLAKISDKFGTLIVDEAHHVPASTFTKVVSNFNPFYIFGLTATPYRTDNLESLMFQTLGEVVVEISTYKVAKQGGIIIPVVKYRAIPSKPIEGNDIKQILKNYIVENDTRNEMIVGDVLKEAMEGNYCIVISDRRRHCEKLFELISVHWDNVGITTGKYNKKHIDEQIEKLYKKEITVLVTTFELLGEGFDVDFLNRAFIAMPFRAERKAEQLIGRLQRMAKGKKTAIVYDYVDVNVGVLKSQFYTSSEKNCRYKCYERLGVHILPYEE
jgi:superfamily II DNA or RNA helicase